MPLEEAQRLADDESIPLELVDIEDEHAALERVTADLEAARLGVAALAQMGPEGAEPSRLADQAAAVAPGATAPAPAGEDEGG